MSCYFQSLSAAKATMSCGGGGWLWTFKKYMDTGTSEVKFINHESCLYKHKAERECLGMQPVPRSHTPVLLQVGDGPVADVAAVHGTRKAYGRHTLIGRLQGRL